MSKPEFLSEVRTTGGALRFYWTASPGLRRRLKGSGLKTQRRLPDERDAAYEACRAITAEVKRTLEAAGALVAAAEAPAAGELVKPAEGQALAPAQLAVIRNTEGTVAWAIAEWKMLPRFKRLQKQTKRQYDWIFGLVEDWGGHRRLRDVSEDRVRAAAERLEARPRTQQLFLILLNALVSRAVNRRLPGVTANPVAEVMADMQWEDPKGGWVWPRAAVPLFARAADALGRASIGTAAILDEWMAQRPIDLVMQPRECYVDGVVHVWQRKTGEYVPLPVDAVPHLRARLEHQFALDREQKVKPLKPATLLLSEATHEPWSLNHFRREFARIRDALAGAGAIADRKVLEAAGIAPTPRFVLDAIPRRLREAKARAPATEFTVATTDLWFAHLRHTGITRLHQAGCTDAEIRSVSAHTAPDTVYKYYLSTTETVARTAFAKRVAHEKEGA